MITESSFTTATSRTVNAMSFSTEAKTELNAHLPASRAEALAGAAAILGCIGSYDADPDGRIRFLLQTDNPLPMIRVFTLIQKIDNINLEFVTDGQPRAAASRFSMEQVLREDKIREYAFAAGLCDAQGNPLSETGRAADAVLRSRKCVRSYIENLFLCVGQVSDPEKEYHLEFACGRPAQAELVLDLLQTFGIQAKSARRRSRFVIYMTEAGSIADTLNLMGANVCAMKLENSRILKQVRGDVNRKVNCETANIRKSVSAAQRQLEDIRFLIEKGALSGLPEPLQEIARKRAAHPEISLTELGALLEPPVGKSGVNHRLRKLSEIAGKIRRETPAEE